MVSPIVNYLLFLFVILLRKLFYSRTWPSNGNSLLYIFFYIPVFAVKLLAAQQKGHDIEMKNNTLF